MSDPLKLPLKPIMNPESVALWPLPVGWWCVIALGIAIVLLSVFFYYIRKNRIRRIACRALRQHYESYLIDQNKAKFIQTLSYTLRQIAVQVYPKEVASQSPAIWLQTLDAPFSDKPFTEGVGRCLLEGPYLPPERCETIAVEALYVLCLRWAKTI
ncbi:MAG: DUF4381 domain-containing protein [Gammaproteobacteria bacterium]